ncbi:hypothetical protein [Pedobacter sp. SYP-B3415]|uniref:hypothetical protein n=1 Tax=Pedobacter sp. SYP-B3415 TaxID=2496641 RepID=UPI00101D244D|nr:hypothetical protein [Pedobacter sp. SYP-B3415]
MPNHIHIFVALPTFLKQFGDVIRSASLNVYSRQSERKHTSVDLSNSDKEFIIPNGGNRPLLFFTSEAFDETQHRSTYDDRFVMHAIEVMGGRSTATDLEKLSLRIISKTPDQKIKAFEQT